jgi:beta-N-acetylhexosaminidase
MSGAELPGPLVLGLDGEDLGPEESELLRAPAVGGVVLFDRHDRGPEALRGLLARLRALPRPLLVAVDQEGGRVQRLRAGFSALPPPPVFGAVAAHDPAFARRAARVAGWLAAVELAAFGIDLAFAPVVDLAAPRSLVLAGRTFAAAPETVALLAGAAAEGLRAGGLTPVFKHFPGHGGVAADTHTTEAIDPRGLTDFVERDLVPYRRLLAEGPAAVMTAHVRVPAVDALPASLSPVWNRTVLRERLGFRGAIVCDDVAMEGLAAYGDPLARARSALAAGADVVLACHLPRAECVRLCEGLRDHDPDAARRRAALRGRGRVRSLADLRLDPAWRRARRLLAGVERHLAGRDPGP